jgi:spermidine synthase
MLLVFSSGVAVMGLEMSASRLIAPYFGSTLSVWTSLIGLVLIFLTGGYFLGGVLADRYSSRPLLGVLVVTAGALVTLVPALSAPVLRAAWDLTPKAGLLVSSLAGTFALFSLPMMLLGCVCPFAMKLSVENLGHTGRTSARIYAVSALGSVVGTFLPALVMIDRWGVRRSIMVFGVLLIAAGLLLLSRLRFLPAAAPAMLLLLPLPPLLSAEGTIAQEESQYSYLQVVDVGESRVLVADWGVFSVYTPGTFRTRQYFDYLLLAPLLREQPPRTWLRNVLIVGLGSGTVSKQLTEAYGPVPVDGVEIDPAIVEMGRRYFDMTEPNLSVHVTDGRVFLGTHARRYDWVVIDAYQGSDIPFHLVTQEFFEALREHMTPGGVLSVNIAWWQPDDQELLHRVAASVRRAFASVYAITDISAQSGAVLLAGGGDVSPGYILANAETVGHGGLIEIAREVVGDGRGAVRLSSMEAPGQPLTDDRAPVEEIADRMYRRAREQQHRREQKSLAR